MKELKPLYYIQRPIPHLLSHILGLYELLLLNNVEREKLADQVKVGFFFRVSKIIPKKIANLHT